MNRTTAWFGCALAVAAGVAAAAQGVSSEDVARAIDQGTKGNVQHATCLAAGFNDAQQRSAYDVVIEGPLGRIMAAAQKAHDRHEAFSAADVTTDLKQPIVTIALRAKQSDPVTTRPSASPVSGRPDPIKEISLRSPATKDRPAIVLAPESAGNFADVYEFDLTRFTAMPPGDIELVVDTGSTRKSSGYSCKISAKDRQSVR